MVSLWGVRSAVIADFVVIGVIDGMVLIVVIFVMHVTIVMNVYSCCRCTCCCCG